ncbi:MAG TPA: MCE family protein [Actinomycetota bacterium]|nr:MCE family protein [Actinomycetota bacterium]
MSIKNFRERSPILIGIVSILALAAGTTFAFSIDKLPALKNAYEIEGEFRDAAGLKTENQVRVAGIKVGTVSRIELDGDKVVVAMEIDNGIRIPDDAFAEIKLATLLGTKFVDIEAKGGGPFLEAGDVIGIENTSIPYEIYQASNQGTNVLEELDGPALNDAIAQLAKLVETSKEELGAALSGLNELGAGLNAKDEDLRSLLAGAGELTDLLADEGDEINRLIAESDLVLGVLARKREDVQSLLEATRLMSGQLADLLRDNRANVDGILKELHRALVVLEANVEHLDVAMEYAGPSARYFGSIFQQGRWGDIYSCGLVLSPTCEEG